MHTRPCTLFDPKNHLEHQLTLSLLCSSNLLLQTSFCLDPPSFPALPSQAFHCHPSPRRGQEPQMLISWQWWLLSSPSWDPSPLLEHLPTSAPPAMGFHRTLSPPSYTTVPPPLPLPQREWPSSCISHGILKPKYRLQLPEIYFKRMQRTKSKIYFRKSKCI